VEGVDVTYCRLGPLVNEDDIACCVVHRASGVKVFSARDTTRHENRRMAMAMLEAWMGVLDKAKGTSLKANVSDASLVPEGATAVEARGSATGWSLVFKTPTGEVIVHIGDMDRAIKLSMRLTGYIRKLRSKCLD